jgi:hypothetical protein
MYGDDNRQFLPSAAPNPDYPPDDSHLPLISKLMMAGFYSGRRRLYPRRGRSQLRLRQRPFCIS